MKVDRETTRIIDDLKAGRLWSPVPIYQCPKPLRPFQSPRLGVGVEFIEFLQ